MSMPQGPGGPPGNQGPPPGYQGPGRPPDAPTPNFPPPGYGQPGQPQHGPQQPPPQHGQPQHGVQPGIQYFAGPGYGGAYGQNAPAGPSTPKQPKIVTTVWVLGLVAVAAVVLGLSLDENGNNAWHAVHAWGAVPIIGAVATLAPALRGSLSPHRAWQVAAGGAGALVLFWVLFTLPGVGSNTSLLVTVGVAAGTIAAWVAPGRDADRQPSGPHAGPGGHAW